MNRVRRINGSRLRIALAALLASAMSIGNAGAANAPPVHYRVISYAV